MKKLLAVLLALSFVLGASSLAFADQAQPAAKTTAKSKRSKHRKAKKNRRAKKTTKAPSR